MTFTISDITSERLRHESTASKEAMSRIVENAIWIYLMMKQASPTQADLLNKQVDNLREVIDKNQLTIDDVLAPLKKKGK